MIQKPLRSSDSTADFTFFTEKSKTKPKNFYGKTKLNIESFIIKKNFNNLVILRLFNIIGMTKKFKPKNFGNFKYQRLLFKMIYNYKKKNSSIHQLY